MSEPPSREAVRYRLATGERRSGILAGLVAGVLTQPLGPPPIPGMPMGR